MEPPTLGITILIVLAFTIISQLLLQNSQHKKRYSDLKVRLDRLEGEIKKSN